MDKKTLLGRFSEVGDIVEWNGSNWRVRAHILRHSLQGGSVWVTKLVRVGRIGGLS